MATAKKQAAPVKAAAKKDEPKPEPKKAETVELPAPPEGSRYVLVSADYCPNGTCPLHLDDPFAYLQTPGQREAERARAAEIEAVADES